MNRFLLLLILPFLRVIPVSGIPWPRDEAGDPNLFSSCVLRQEPMTPQVKDTLIIHYDSVRAALLSAVIVAPRDSFPIQVGAYRNRDNADKTLIGVKQLTDVNVRIVTENGLYKVRIDRFPADLGEPEREKTVNAVEEQSGSADTATVTVTVTPVVEATPVAYIPSAGKPSADTIRTAVADTIYRDGEIIFFGKDSPWLRRVKYFGESFSFVNALIITIMVSILSMITLLIVILLHRRHLEQEEKIRQYLMEKYQGLIVDYLFGTTSAEEFRSIARDRFSRQVLIDQMIDVSINLKGEESQKLIGLYKYLGLDRDSIARARDYRWHKKIKGFRELAFMDIKDAIDSMRKALNSSNEILRMEAQISLVRLSDQDHFEFLSHLKRPFSLWEQITLHDMIIQHEIPVPTFSKWLVSDNDSVAIFALRMIKEFRQIEAEDEVRQAMAHSSAEVRFTAVQVAGDMGFVSALETMKKMYKTQDYRICLEIVRSMGKMPDTSMLGFLKLVLDKEDDVQLQIEATKAIEKMGEEGVKALVKIMKSEYKNYNIIVRHILDRRIN